MQVCLSSRGKKPVHKVIYDLAWPQMVIAQTIQVKCLSCIFRIKKYCGTPGRWIISVHLNHRVGNYNFTPTTTCIWSHRGHWLYSSHWGKHSKRSQDGSAHFAFEKKFKASVADNLQLQGASSWAKEEEIQWVFHTLHYPQANSITECTDGSVKRSAKNSWLWVIYSCIATSGIFVSNDKPCNH